MQEKQIHSAEDFQIAVSAADERAENLKTQKTELVQKISDTEKMIEEIPLYLEILNRRHLMPNDIKELSKFTHLKDVAITFLGELFEISKFM